MIATPRLAPGARLGPYEIVAAIGAGGMGQVYRARDTRLDRTVAIKVLHDIGQSEPQLRERFEREARLIASLDHPHICALHDLGREDGVDYLVMPYLEGENLADRLRRGPLPLPQALEVARQIADALDSAHRVGIVHRDLKPANIILTKTGARLLDFGVARMESGTVGADVERTHQALTAVGAVVGTVPYMSPEQISGAPADTRSDIWAFGCVLYEMITGRRPFHGDDQTALVSAIMASQPQAPSQSTSQIPPALDHIIAGTLAKDREDRWQSMRDVKRALALIAPDHVDRPAAPAVTTPQWLYPALVLLLLTTIVLTWVATRTWRGMPAPTVVRFDVGPTGNGTIANFSDTRPNFAVSPDGRRIAFTATIDGSSDIWIKALDDAQPQRVSDTAFAQSPFWSPDSQSIAFVAGGQLKRKALPNGATQVICDVNITGSGINGTWNANGDILFAEWATRRLLRVSDRGGTPAVVRSGQSPFGWPQFLPDGRRFLFVTLDLDKYAVPAFVGSLDSDVTTPIPGVESRMAFAADHLVFWREGTLVAQPFDLDTMQLSGDVISLGEQVRGFLPTGHAAFSAVPNLLAYQSGLVSNRLVWVDRQGVELEALDVVGEHLAVRLSRDASNIALSDRDPRLGTADVLIHEVPRKITRRLTSERGTENVPIWSPDGNTVIFAADRKGPPSLYARDAQGATNERAIVPPSVGPQVAGSFTPDGRSVVYMQPNPGTLADIMLAPIDGHEPPMAIVKTNRADMEPVLSADGRWLAFVSNQTGRSEVYVQPLDDSQGRRQVSRDGGVSPRWRADGKELFYLSRDDQSQLIAVDMTVSGSFIQPGVPRLLFKRHTRIPAYDVAPDGQRFLIIAADPVAERGTLSAIVNWTGLLGAGAARR